MTVWVGSGTTGGLVDDDMAAVSVFDHGFTVGDGIFETMKVLDGRIFLWPWHLQRLTTSAQVMGIPLPPAEHLTDVVRAVVANGGGAGVQRLRLTLTAGMGPLGSARHDEPATVVCAITAAPVRGPFAAVAVMPWPRNEHSPLVGVKCTSYAENVLALAHARAADADEALFMNTAGNLCEGTGSNVFAVFGDRVITPPPSAGILPGITRRFVLQLAGEGVEVVEQDLPMAMLQEADEVFLTSTFRDVAAVQRLDGRVMATGPVTAELAHRFERAAATAANWT